MERLQQLQYDDRGYHARVIVAAPLISPLTKASRADFV
jgi:hypothetical protein